MADILTKQERSKLMSHIRSSGTKPEVTLRRALWRRGLRYRVNVKGLPGTPDIVLPKHRSVVFVHGCFWHGHKGCKVYHVPQTNPQFWRDKIARNQARDQEVWRQLEAKGWSVLIVWECELNKIRFNETVDRVIKEIITNGDSYRLRNKERCEEKHLRIQEKKEAYARRLLLLKELASNQNSHK